MWCIKLLIYFLILSFFLGNEILAQNLVYRSFKTEDGLPSNTIYSIFSDFDGFLYISTDNGIVKFDGSQFTRLKQHPLLNSTAHTWLERVSENQKLLGYSFGETFIEVRNDSVLPVYNDYFDRVPIPGECHYYMSKKGDFYYTALDSLYLINSDGKKISYDYGLKKKTFATFNPTLVSDSILWTIYNQFYTAKIDFNPNKIQSKYFKHPINVNLNTNFQQKLFSFKSKLYLLINDFETIKVFEINPITGEQKQTTWDSQLNLVKARLLRIFNDDENLWLTSYNGCFKIKLDSSSIVQNHYFPGKIINDMEIDREGNYWFSVFNEGLFWVGDLNSKHWTTENSSFQTNVLSTVQSNGNNLIIGNNLGKIGISSNNNSTWDWFDIGINRGFEALSFTSKQNQYLVSGQGLFLVNTKNTSIKKLINASIKAISIIDNNNYLIGTHANSGILTIESNLSFSFDSLINQRTNAVVFDRFTKDYYLGCSDNLYIYSFSDNYSNPKIVFDNLKKPILAKYLIQSIDSSIWVGTKTAGLQQIKNKKWKSNRGFVNNEKLSINSLATKDNYVYAATNNGILTIEINSNRELLFTPSKGLINKEVNSIAVSDNKLFLATSNGLQELKLSSLKNLSIEPRTYIRSIKLKDSVLSKLTNNFEIERFDFPIEIEFGAISFKHSDRVRFEYRLKGLSNEWQTTDKNSAFVRYYSLQPGSYTFEVFSINGDNIRDKIGAQLSILIRPPFWMTIWFWLILILILAFSIYKVIQYREKRMLQSERIANEREYLLQELRISQLSTIKAQMNPHFIFNALNSIQNFVFKNDRISANTYLGKFSDLMRLILKQSNEAKITLEDELKALNLYLELESVRFKEHLSYSIDFDSIPDLNSILIPSMIIQPYVENAIKHGILHKKNPGSVSITFNQEDDLLLVEIKDDGIGRKKSEEIQLKKIKKFESFATKATEKRLNLLNLDLNKSIHVTISDLFDPSGKSSGTLVQLSIPIFKQDE